MAYKAWEQRNADKIAERSAELKRQRLADRQLNVQKAGLLKQISTLSSIDELQSILQSVQASKQNV